MTDKLSPQQLWDSAAESGTPIQPAELKMLPEPVRRYLAHAINPRTPLASAVRVHMEGEIKLNDRWFPFTAEQVIAWERGFIWQASVKMFGLPVRGSDRLIDGQGAMRWRLLGLVPLVTADGSDITRSAAGRVAAESIWLPSVLRSERVLWSSSDPTQVTAKFTAYGEPIELTLTIDEHGRLKCVWLPRWGDPGDGGFRYEIFGSFVDDEQTFSGYTIPTRIRAGWYFGQDRFESGGEFFRANITEASYR